MATCDRWRFASNAKQAFVASASSGSTSTRSTGQTSIAGTPLEESWSAMAELVDEGKVRWIGVSNFERRAARTVRGGPPCRLPPAPVVDGPARSAEERDPVGSSAPNRGDRVLPDGLRAAERKFDRDRLEGLAPDDMRLARPEFAEPSCPRTWRSSSGCARSQTPRLFGGRACDRLDSRAGRRDQRDRRRPPAKSTRPVDRRRPPRALGGTTSRNQRCDRRDRRGNGAASNPATAIGDSNVRAALTGQGG